MFPVQSQAELLPSKSVEIMDLEGCKSLYDFPFTDVKRRLTHLVIWVAAVWIDSERVKQNVKSHNVYASHSSKKIFSKLQ